MRAALPAGPGRGAEGVGSKPSASDNYCSSRESWSVSWHWDSCVFPVETLGLARTVPLSVVLLEKKGL